MIDALIIVVAALFLVSVLVSTRIMRRSLSALTPEEKARLVDPAAATPIWSFMAMVAVLAIWLMLIFVVRDYTRLATPSRSRHSCSSAPRPA
ncbi:MAG: hypothetical protein QOI24_4554 [Acidobacteriota bacterium]|nr:hypothetical protein [Acidobacteriota bacterium]